MGNQSRKQRTVLLTLGRLPKALAIARACRAVGCRVIVADPFRWHVCRPSRAVDRNYRVTAPNDSLRGFYDDLLKIIRDERVDLVIPISEEALHVAGLRDRLPEGVALWCGSTEDLANYHDKLRFIRTAGDRGMSVPRTLTADDSAARTFAASADYVEKPVHSCSGIGLRLARAGEPVEASSSSVIVQERLEGDHISTRPR